MSCPLCNSEEYGPVYNGIGNFVICLKCRLVYSKEGYDKKIYEKDYFTKEGESQGRNFLSSWAALYDEARFSQEIQNIKSLKPNGKVLDIGCATGSFLKKMDDEGYTPVGIDVSDFAIEHIKKEYGYSAYCGLLSEIKFEKKMFDIITLHHVIEHLNKPVEFLRNEVRPLLKDDGLIVVETPNFASIESMVNRQNWVDLRAGEHLIQFTTKTLKQCLLKADFKIKKIVTYNPHFHRNLWRYPQILSYAGFKESTIQLIGKSLFGKRVSDSKSSATENSGMELRKIGLLDTLTRPFMIPLDFLYSKLYFGKNVVIYASNSNLQSKMITRKQGRGDETVQRRGLFSEQPFTARSR